MSLKASSKRTKSFVDLKGRVWIVELDETKDRRLREIGFDLKNKPTECFVILALKPLDVAPIIETIIGDQLEAAGVSIDDFRDSLEGDQIQRIGLAIIWAATDYFGPIFQGTEPKIRQYFLDD